jgi:two-component system nitrate/nitrite sensor histidine kinase NarX
MKRVFSKLKVSSHKLRAKRLTSNIFASSSIVARAGQIMALIISFAVISMISSMLVTESLSGDAEQINKAGALRMQAIRISRAFILEVKIDKVLEETNNSRSPTSMAYELEQEIINFEQRIDHLFDGGLTSARDDYAIEQQYQAILSLWRRIQQLSEEQFSLDESINLIDQFVVEIDQLVTLLQYRSEKKLSLLRSIQGISLLSVLVIAFAVLYSLNRKVIVPLKELVSVAKHVGKGEFNVKAGYQSDNELGMLASAINQMSSELELMHQGLEQRVADKTKALRQTNRSLQTLYQAANQLVTNDLRSSDEKIIDDLELSLGQGKIHIERYNIIEDRESGSNASGINLELPNSGSSSATCLQRFEFPLQKEEQKYGIIIWQLPNDVKPKSWQTQILRAMADIISTAIDLEYRRNTESRLLIMEERAVIARELHDSLAQSLSYLKVQMSLLKRKMDKNVGAETINDTIQDINNGLNSAYRQLRELLTTFRLKLDDPSLFNALQGTIIEFTEKCNHSIALDFDLPKNRLTANQEIHVLQIIREALSNVHRHSQASKAGVELSTHEGNITVKIWDDGIGLNSANAPLTEPGHFGMSIMNERASSLDSRLSVEPRRPQGTLVTLKFK